jgi:hypothetical protein
MTGVSVPQRVASIDAVSYFEHTVWGPVVGLGSALPQLSLFSGTPPGTEAGGQQCNDLLGESGRLPNAASGQIRGVYCEFSSRPSVSDTVIQAAARSRFVRELNVIYQAVLVVGDVTVCRFPMRIHGSPGASLQGISDASSALQGLHETSSQPMRGAFLKHPIGSNQRVRVDLVPRISTVPVAQRLAANADAAFIRLTVGIEVEIATAVMAVR